MGNYRRIPRLAVAVQVRRGHEHSRISMLGAGELAAWGQMAEGSRGANVSSFAFARRRALVWGGSLDGYAVEFGQPSSLGISIRVYANLRLAKKHCLQYADRLAGLLLHTATHKGKSTVPQPA